MRKGGRGKDTEEKKGRYKKRKEKEDRIKGERERRVARNVEIKAKEEIEGGKGSGRQGSNE